MTKLGVSIVNYKTRELTTKCLESILQRDWKFSYEIWLVDNNSNDGSVQFFKSSFPKVHLVESRKNLGFAGGHNLALKKIKSDYILILNSDTEVEGKALDEMVSFLGTHPETGIASCKILGFDGKLQPNGGDLPTGSALFNWLFNLESLGFKSSFHRNEPEYYQKEHEVGWVSGSFMMVRREVFGSIAYLSEDYFMYFEDVELCFRAKKGGFKVMINPAVYIKHLSGGSSADPKLKQWSGEFQGLLIFYQNYFGTLSALLVRILIYFSTFLRILAFALMGKFNYCLTYVKLISSL